MRRIACHSVTAENFSRFGLVVDAEGATPEFINEGTTKRFPDLASFDTGVQAASPVIGIYLANARTFPLRIAKLERHRQASQVFIPLGMHRFVVVVAGPGNSRLGTGHGILDIARPRHLFASRNLAPRSDRPQ